MIATLPKKTMIAVLLALSAGSISLVPLAASAAAPQVRTQAPGFYRTMLGDFEITALSDGSHPFPIDTVMTDISQAEIGRDLARDDLAQPVQGSINAFLINTGSKLILVDTGAGVLYGDCCGRLMANLRAAGYQPEQVDEVLLTHLHKDHAGGIIADGKMAFPNAVLRASQTDVDYWTTATNKARAPDFLASFFDSAKAVLAPYIAAGRLKTFSGEQALESGIRAVPEPGHTPGHTMYEVTSAGQTLLVWGDIVHVASIQLQHPKASVKYDTSAKDAQASRQALLTLAAQRKLLVGAAHIAFPGLGHIRASDAGYDWIPLNYDAAPGRR